MPIDPSFMQAICPQVKQEINSNHNTLRFLVPLALLTCAAGLLLGGFRFSDLREGLDPFGNWTPLIFMVCGVIAMTVLIPKTVVSVTAGAMFGTLLGGLLLLCIAVIAAMVNYSIARWWLHDAICRKLDRDAEIGSRRWMMAIRDLAAVSGFRFHLMVRLTPIPTTLISYTMGASGSRLGPFLLAAAVAVLPQLLWVHSGASAMVLADGSASAIHWVSVMISVAAAIITSVLVPRMALQKINSMD